MVKMSIAVPKDILEQTKCPHAFSCLDSGKCGTRKLCEVAAVAGTGLLALKNVGSCLPSHCSYLVPFGRSYFCGCPTFVYAFSHKK
jgi:hypothetical protein